MDRDSRRLSHGKGNKIITQSNTPLGSDGDDGDQIIVGSTLYTKSQGRWMPFKSGGGNVNDGWHGSQKYVKILPTDFLSDNEAVVSTEPALSYADSLDPLLSYAANQGYVPSPATDGSLGLYRSSSGVDNFRGVGAFVSIPLGYWAIACKIYTNATITNHLMVFAADLTDGSASTLLKVKGDTNTRIIFDTAMLGQEQNYIHITINNLPTNGLTYGGYIELRRLKTAEAIAEEESETGGDILTRQTGG